MATVTCAARAEIPDAAFTRDRGLRFKLSPLWGQRPGSSSLRLGRSESGPPKSSGPRPGPGARGSSSEWPSGSPGVPAAHGSRVPLRGPGGSGDLEGRRAAGRTGAHRLRLSRSSHWHKPAAGDSDSDAGRGVGGGTRARPLGPYWQPQAELEAY
jgi:hypothetical protein